MSRFLALMILALVGCSNTPVPSDRDYWQGEFRLSSELSPEQISGFIRAADAWYAATEGRVDLRIAAIVTVPELQPWEAWSVTRGDRGGSKLGTADGSAVMLDDREMTEDKAYRVALHEIGHVVGLEHNDTPGSLMYYKTSPKVTGVDDLALEALENVR